MKKFLCVFALLVAVESPRAVALVNFEPFNELRAMISADDIVGVGKNIIFDASKSATLNTKDPVKYTWDFGDGSAREIEQEVVHTYKNPGEYHITLTIKQGQETASISRDIFVYAKLVVLITDAAEKADSIAALADGAKADGAYLDIVSNYDNISAFVTEEILTQKLADRINTLRNADHFIVWTVQGSGMNTLTRLTRENNLDDDFFKGKTIVQITDENIKTIARTLQSHYNLMHPRQIIVTRQYELKNLLSAGTIDEFVAALKSGVSEYVLINEETGRVSLLNFVSYLVNFMIAQGVPSNTIILLLMLPLIATIVAFMKQVVGMTTFGVYTPSVIALSFMALGLKFGLAILILIVLTGAVLRIALERFELLHIPRVTIIFTISALLLLLMLALGTYAGVSQIATIAVFPMLIMTTLAEKFVGTQTGRGFLTALLLVGETTLVSLLCYGVAQWKYIQTLFLGYPEIIFLLIAINILLGRWTGLRLLEYVRFRDVIKHIEE